MTSQQNDPRITAYVFGELSPDETARFEQELAASKLLADEVAATRSAIAALESEFAGESEGLDDAARQAVQSAALGSLATPAASWLHGNRTPITLVSLAAVVLLVVGIAFVNSDSDVQSGVAFRRFSQMEEADNSGVFEGAELQSGLEASRKESLAAIPAPMSGTVTEQHEAGDTMTFTTRVPTSESGEKSTKPESKLTLGSDDFSILGAARQSDRENRGLSQMEEEFTRDMETMGTGEVRYNNLPVFLMREVDSAIPRWRNVDVIWHDATWAMDRSFTPHPRPPSWGMGPDISGDKHDLIVENPFLRVNDQPLSTFSIDVDSASYSKVRMYLSQHKTLPRPDAVRIEELINYFNYDDAPPAEDDPHPFAATMHVAGCPWNADHRLARIGLKGKTIEKQRPSSNLVFLLDVSGSMNKPNKLPLVIEGMKMLTGKLSENDSVAIVVYAGAAGVVLNSTSGEHRADIAAALERLKAGGSTNGGEGIALAYNIARDNFIPGGTNRVILCTDGDFNVGVTGTDELVRMAAENAKGNIFLTVLGFGMGNHNDAMMEQISNRGNGNYAFIDSRSEARRVLVEQISATLVTIAKDVKIQVEFNPATVAAYRLIGYENRILASQDFNDDKKDAGEIGAGHTVTALYEIVPTSDEDDSVATSPVVDDLRYQKKARLSKQAGSGEMLTLKLRYKEPEGSNSTLIEFPVKDQGQRFEQADNDFRFAASVAAFGMLLRNSAYKGNITYAAVKELAEEAVADSEDAYRTEFLELVDMAADIDQASAASSANPVNKASAKRNGVVLQVDLASQLVLISIGYDDGLRTNHQLNVTRGTDSICKLRVRKTHPNQAVAEILATSSNVDVQPGDRVGVSGSHDEATENVDEK
ncbi:MAG: von Willebrand factor type A domain-containing protein [Pirellulaceae bacterium]